MNDQLNSLTCHDIQVPAKRKIKKVSVDSTKILEKSKKPITKLGATDYRAWEKFDADAELERLEDDINDDSELTDECNEQEYDQAVLEKEKVFAKESCMSI